MVKENVLRKYPGAGGESNFIIGVGSRASETESAEAEADAFLDVTEEGDKYLQCAKAIGLMRWRRRSRTPSGTMHAGTVSQ